MSLRITPVDDKKVEEGTWTTYRGVRLKIARGNNPKFRALFMKLTKPYQKQLVNQNLAALDEETMKDIMARVMSETILLDWNNFSIDGKEVPYTKENAYALLYNDSDCRDYVREFADDVDNYLKEEENEIAGK